MPRPSHSIRQGNDPLLPLVVGAHASVAAVHEDLLDLIHCVRLLFGRLSLLCSELRVFANQEFVTKDRNWPLGAKVALRIGPSLSALQFCVGISQLEKERLKNPPRTAVEVIDKESGHLMVGLVELPSPFDIVVVAKYPLTDRQTVRKQRHETGEVTVG